MQGGGYQGAQQLGLRTSMPSQARLSPVGGGQYQSPPSRFGQMQPAGSQRVVRSQSLDGSEDYVGEMQGLALRRPPGQFAR